MLTLICEHEDLEDLEAIVLLVHFIQVQLSRAASMEGSSRSIQLALPSHTNSLVIVHVHLTFFKTNTMLFLTTTGAGDSEGLTPMGSFVYAMPNVVLLGLILFLI